MMESDFTDRCLSIDTYQMCTEGTVEVGSFLLTPANAFWSSFHPKAIF